MASSQLLPLLEKAVHESIKVVESERKNLRSELKPDGSIVTNVDKAVERYLRGVLPSIIPGSTVWGEEEGFDPIGDAGQWLVDPIDGTSNFSFRSPLWGISIGYMVDGRLKLGAVALPDLKELYLGQDGGGALLNGKPMSEVAKGPIERYELVSLRESQIKKWTTGQMYGRPRMSGAFVIDAMFTASGRYRAMACGGESLYDAAGSIVIARECGLLTVQMDGQAKPIGAFKEGLYQRPGSVGAPWGFFPVGSQFDLGE